MKLEELNVYNVSMELGEEVWDCVKDWDQFSKRTIGKQLVEAADSVAANISEGFGRFHYKENKNFCYYARGSLFETMTWITKAFNRGFISIEKHEFFKEKINNSGRLLNRYINSIGKNNNIINEDETPYGL
ncbi:MAG: four helix bundle protein [Bacteroidota bacterium]|nr:four helix bundle protein [Bacteroidota bacterium]